MVVMLITLQENRCRSWIQHLASRSRNLAMASGIWQANNRASHAVGIGHRSRVAGVSEWRGSGLAAPHCSNRIIDLFESAAHLERKHRRQISFDNQLGFFSKSPVNECCGLR
jgi:hypothetical protein